MAIAGAVELVKGLGAGPCAAYLEKLIGNITKVASGEALCQLAEEDEEEMEEEEEQEVLLKPILLSRVMALRGSPLVRASKSHSGPLMRQADRCSPSRDASLRQEPWLSSCKALSGAASQVTGNPTCRRTLMRTCWWRWGMRCQPWRLPWARTRTRPSSRSSTRRPCSSGCAAASRTACAPQAQVRASAQSTAWPCARFPGGKKSPPREAAHVLPSLLRRGHAVNFLEDLILPCCACHWEGSGGPLSCLECGDADMLSHAAGAVAEVARELGAHMVPYVPRLVPILLRELRCESSDNRRNAAFAAGTLASAAPAACSPHMLNMLQVCISTLRLASAQMAYAVHITLLRPAPKGLDYCALKHASREGRHVQAIDAACITSLLPLLHMSNLSLEGCAGSGAC